MCTIRALKTWPLRQVKKVTSFRFWVITSETQTRCHKLHGHQLNAKDQMSGWRLLCITMRTANNSRINRYLGQKWILWWRISFWFWYPYYMRVYATFIVRLCTIACINLHISEIWYPLFSTILHEHKLIQLYLLYLQFVMLRPALKGHQTVYTIHSSIYDSLFSSKGLYFQI